MWQKNLLSCQIRLGAYSFLSIDDTVLKKGEIKAAHHRQEVLNIILPKSYVYPGVEKQGGLMGGPIVWLGREYPSGVLPPENVVREILWGLYEVNFIQGLQSLDRRKKSRPFKMLWIYQRINNFILIAE
jgi:hypothetical protein